MNSDFCQGGGAITSFLNSPYRYARGEEHFVAYMIERSWQIGEGVYSSSDDHDPPRRYVRIAHDKAQGNWDADLWEYEATVNYPELLKPLYDRLYDNNSPIPEIRSGQSLIAQVMTVLLSRVPNHCPGAVDCFDVVNQKHHGRASWDGAAEMPFIGLNYGWKRILILDEKFDTWRKSATDSTVLVGISGMLKRVGVERRGSVFINTNEDSAVMDYVAVTSPVKCRNMAEIALSKCARNVLSQELDIFRPRIVIYRGSANTASIIGQELKKGFYISQREPGFHVGRLTYSIDDPQVHPFIRPPNTAEADFYLFDNAESF